MKRRVLAAVAVLSFLICFHAARQNAVTPQPGRRHFDTIPQLASSASAGESKGGRLLEELEQHLTRSLQRERGPWSGERLAELCLTVKNREPLGFDAVSLYASGWAKADPAGMYQWFAARGSFALTAGGGFGFSFDSTILNEWGQQDPDAALAAAAAHGGDKSMALAAVISGLLRTDPARAIQAAAQHLSALSRNGGRWLGNDVPGMWKMLSELPGGSDRGRLMAAWLRQRVDDGEFTVEQARQHWLDAPEAVRRDLAANGFVLTRKDAGEATGAANEIGQASIPSEPVVRAIPMEGLDEMARTHAEQSQQPEAAARFLAVHGQAWAEREPAAAVQWALAHLRGRARVNETVALFRHAGANFEAALAAWQTLPDGILRARAAGALAAGAPESQSAAVAQVIESLAPADRRVAEDERKHRRADWRLDQAQSGLAPRAMNSSRRHE